LSSQGVAGRADDTRVLWRELSSLVWNIREEICDCVAATEALPPKNSERCTCMHLEWHRTCLYHRKIHLPEAERLHMVQSEKKHKLRF